MSVQQSQGCNEDLGCLQGRLKEADPWGDQLDLSGSAKVGIKSYGSALVRVRWRVSDEALWIRG